MGSKLSQASIGRTPPACCSGRWLLQRLDWLADRIFGVRCLLCHEPLPAGLPICPGCRDELPWNRNPCRRCAIPLPPGSDLCGHCQTTPPPWESAWAPFLYRDPVDRLIVDLKFRRRLEAGRLLGGLMAEALHRRSRLQEWPEVVLPVPLHAARLRERGYNQGALLGRWLRRAGLAVDQGACRRIRATRAQSRLSGDERRANLRDAFALRQPRWQHVAILDDVLTTGSTAAEMARLLRRHGVAQIEVWVVARAGIYSVRGVGERAPVWRE